MSIHVDKSRVPADKLSDPRLTEAEADVCQKLKDGFTRMYACVHESAHALYMERAGIAFTFRGPSIWYDSKHDIFRGGLAGVAPGTSGEDYAVNSLQLARWSVAGFVVAETLLPTAKHLEDTDTSDFETFADDMRERRASEESISAHWKQAKSDVTKDLQNVELRQAIWDQALVFNRQLETFSAALAAGGGHMFDVSRIGTGELGTNPLAFLKITSLLKMAGILAHAGMTAPQALEKAEQIQTALARDDHIFRDHVPTAGEVAATIYAASQPSTIDGVIAETLNIVEELYRRIGFIEPSTK